MPCRTRAGVFIVIMTGVCVLVYSDRTLAVTQEDVADPGVAHLDILIQNLGHESYVSREEATRQLFARGASVAPALQGHLTTETDPEVCWRLRYIIRNITPPDRAVMLVRAAKETGLHPGTVITHANGRALHYQSELRRLLASSARGLQLRVRESTGPREVGTVQRGQLTELADYLAPRGPTIAEAVRLYADGYAERAQALLDQVSQPVPEGELSRALRARIKYTAGDGSGALELLEDVIDQVRASGPDWSSPSYFDLRGPGKAPYQLEWEMFSRSPRLRQTDNDPDLRIQRVLLPARRYADALVETADYWQNEYRSSLGSDEDVNRLAGNQLAVIAWMLHGMDLRSESCRLIEPRSVVLRNSRRQINKWVRIDTDAWLALLAGDAAAALDGFCDDAIEILQRPPAADDPSALTRNPQVAARLGFFLYQAHDAERAAVALRAVAHHTHPALPAYLDWMLLGINPDNEHLIRRDLHELLPRLPDEHVARFAFATALLEYVQPEPELEVLETAERRLRFVATNPQQRTRAAAVAALIALARAQPDQAQEILKPHRGDPAITSLWHTTEFLLSPLPAARQPALRNPLLAVPFDAERAQWLVLTRGRRLLRFDAADGILAALERPTRSWYPGPANWPWLGQDDTSGRAWVYGRRRVIEIPRSPGEPSLRINIRNEDIATFDRFVRPQFGVFADAALSADTPRGENGEYLRREIAAFAECVADPDLQEIGFIEQLEAAPHIAHVALRGGPQMLIDTTTGKSWTSSWIGRKLSLAQPLTFFAEALWEPARDGGAVIMLTSNQGLIRFEADAEKLARVTLPGEDPHPAVIRESVPYQRRDPRYYYCARLPADGGQVYRLVLEKACIETVDMVNEALPPHYYDLQLRSQIRHDIDRRLAKRDLPNLESLIVNAETAVRDWAEERQREP